MALIGKTFNLIYNDEVLGSLLISETDQPWFMGHFQATASFDQFRPLFEAELKAMDEDGEDEDATADLHTWETLYDKIDALKLKLETADGQETINDFLLHIDGEDAWFRY